MLQMFQILYILPFVVEDGQDDVKAKFLDVLKFLKESIRKFEEQVQSSPTSSFSVLS